MLEVIKQLADLGFMLMAITVCGIFIGILLKYILANVVSDVAMLDDIASMLNDRVRFMNNDLARIDALVSSRFGLRVDLERLSRTNGKDDARRD